MCKKGMKIVILSVFLVLFLSAFVLAQNATEAASSADKGYLCLKDQIEGKNLSLKEATFSVLALGAEGNLVDTIEAQRDPASCWPKGACTIKETAQVALAYNRIGKDTSAIENWLLTKNGTATELKWLLQIDIPNRLASECTVNDGTRENRIRVQEDAKLTGSTGTCLTIDSNGYMLRINNNCINNEFQISCDQDFVTSLLYQKVTGGTLFVLPEAHSAASLGKTTEKAAGDCFKAGAACDYEGSLWAALALQKIGEDISKFTPYLLALADDNAKYFPSAFLYILVGGDDQYNLVVQEQREGRFWEVPGSRDGRFYDTSLAMLSLSDRGGAEIDATKAYLSSIQTNDGCWNNNNIRDTAFLLYSGWPKTVTAFAGAAGSTPCEPALSCEDAFACTQAGGTIEYNYECSNVGESCCSIKLEQQTCEQKGGLLCPSGTSCDGRVESSSDGSCCLDGACIEIEVLEDTCTPAEGICKSTCADGEVESVETCSLSGEVCCIEEGGAGFWFWFWIILLIILIILLIWAIIKREQVKIYYFKIKEKMKNKFAKKPPVQPVGQRGPFAPYPRQMMPAPSQRTVVIQQPPQRFAPLRVRPKDVEMEEALRKLREMAKKK